MGMSHDLEAAIEEGSTHIRVGTALFGFVADRFGRRTIFTFSLLWYSAASVVMAFQNDVFGLNLWRFLSGIGVGVELVTIDAYLSELVPKESRL